MSENAMVQGSVPLLTQLWMVNTRLSCTFWPPEVQSLKSKVQGAGCGAGLRSGRSRGAGDAQEVGREAGAVPPLGEGYLAGEAVDHGHAGGRGDLGGREAA